MEIAIVKYEPWMEAQVCNLFVMNYGVSFEAFQRFFQQFYEAPFQVDQCIRLVAMEDKTVVGFQSFFYWPFRKGKTEIRTYQSGNSLVHPDHRGKGVFGKLLKQGNIALQEKKAALLIGFPVDVSLGSFVRAGWDNSIDLLWHVKPLSPVSALLPAKKGEEFSVENSVDPPLAPDDESMASVADGAFYRWRKQYHPHAYYQVAVEEGKESLLLILKTSKRLKVLNELVIGEVYASTSDPKLLDALARKAMKRIRKEFKGFAFLSFAMNRHSKLPVDQAILQQGFRAINKQIHFVYKPFQEGLSLPPKEDWRLYRGDIDTW